MVTAYGLLIAERALHDANATRIREIDYRRAGPGAARRPSSPWLSARLSGWASSARIAPFPRISQKNGLRKATPAIAL